jgi:protein O-GlcNAc transferase
VISYARAVNEAMSDIDHQLQRAVALHQSGNIEQAQAIYKHILAVSPRNFHALHFSGLTAAQGGHYEDAVRLIGRALEIDPTDVSAQLNMGNALRGLHRVAEAIACYDKVLEIKPDHAGAWNNRGVCLLELHQPHEALKSIERALTLGGRYCDALTNRGNALLALARHAEAVASYEQALSIDASSVQSWSNRGNVLLELGRPDDAIASFGKAIEIGPDYADAYNNLGTALLDLGRPQHARRVLERLVALDPGFDYAQGSLLNARIKCALWSGLDLARASIARRIRSGERADTPFSFLAISDSPADQLLCARVYTADKFPAQAALWRGERYGHGRIRVAYLSADLHHHAIAYLTAGLFETHDRNHFETTAVAFGADTEDDMTARLKPAFDHFFDARRMSNREIAVLLREREIDIAVDLTGYTGEARPAILSHKPCPVQINYLGYPGTMGASWMDYIIADRILIPPEHYTAYSEKIVLLPDSYQANDAKGRISPATPSRTTAGLPEQAFVFCAFNNGYKIQPAAFEMWMRLLRAVDGSVLWLLHNNEEFVENLGREAEARGVSSNRLVFAPILKAEEHLARHRLADLFLDTLPYNAHTTASDALWMGVPVVTCIGTTFAGRVAASLLHAVGLPELVTKNYGEYEALALRLALNPVELQAVKDKLAHNRRQCALFDTGRFTRHLEHAYTVMWQRAERGEPAAHFAVPAT